MKFNKCVRCGCFFTSTDHTCPNCQAKDKIDFQSLKNCLENNNFTNLNTLSLNSGISIKNINRYLETPELSKYKSQLSQGNIPPKISL